MSTGTGTFLDGEAFTAPITRFLIQVTIVVSLSRLIGVLIRHIKQPAVVAEMIAGIILGPTALGRWTAFSEVVFPPASLPIINTISQYALICFMMLVGLEIDASSMVSDGKIAAVVSVASTIIPFAFAAVLAIPLSTPNYSNASFADVTLFLGVAIGMSALPVLARILSEYRLLHTRVGVLTMAMTAFDDVVAWFILAVVSAIVRTGGSIQLLYVFLMIAAHTAVLYFLVRPALKRLSDSSVKSGRMTTTHFFVFMSIVAVNAYVTEMIGITTLVGAFQIGLLQPRNNPLARSLPGALENLVVVVFMPLFFVQTGLRTNFALIDSGEAFGMVVLCIVMATLAKMVGIMLPAALFRIPWRTSIVVAALMSCKGLVALIIVNVGLELGVITPRLYAVLVLMVLVTTIQTVPLTALTVRIRRCCLKPGQVLEEMSVQAKGGRDAAAAAATSPREPESIELGLSFAFALLFSDTSATPGLVSVSHALTKDAKATLELVCVHNEQPFTLPTDVHPERILHEQPAIAVALDRAMCLHDSEQLQVSLSDVICASDTRALVRVIEEKAAHSIVVFDSKTLDMGDFTWLSDAEFISPHEDGSSGALTHRRNTLFSPVDEGTALIKRINIACNMLSTPSSHPIGVLFRHNLPIKIRRTIVVSLFVKQETAAPAVAQSAVAQTVVAQTAQVDGNDGAGTAAVVSPRPVNIVVPDGLCGRDRDVLHLHVTLTPQNTISAIGCGMNQVPTIVSVDTTVPAASAALMPLLEPLKREQAMLLLPVPHKSHSINRAMNGLVTLFIQECARVEVSCLLVLLPAGNLPQ